MFLKKQFKRYYNKLLNTVLTRKSKDGVEYVWKRHSSSTLLINILHEDQIEHFPEHSMVGDYFKVMLSKRFSKFPTK